MFAGAPIPEVGGAPIQTLAPVVSRITPGVVGISVRGRVREDNPLLQDPMFRRFFNMQQQPVERETQATGSGVIVDAAQGYVLTNAHVVENANSIEVTTKDNRRLKAKLIGRDPDTDIAVLQIPGGSSTPAHAGPVEQTKQGGRLAFPAHLPDRSVAGNTERIDDNPGLHPGAFRDCTCVCECGLQRIEHHSVHAVGRLDLSWPGHAIDPPFLTRPPDHRGLHL